MKPTTAIVTALLICPALLAQRPSDLTAPTPLPPKSTLVIGFLGGFERWNDYQRSVRRLTLKLREKPDVYAESISNRHRRVAVELIRRALDVNRNDNLEPEERDSARLILYGQSWGAAAALATARDMDRLGIPVLLTVQVDSVGLHDKIVPANVQAAVNFYQHDPLTLRGQSEIRPADSKKTRILGNFGASYTWRSIEDANTSWVRRTFGGSHAKMEQDPTIWRRVEQYISDAIATR